MLKRLFLSYNRRQELLDCVTHMRLLAWLLHGSLSHFVHCQNPHVNCYPVKFEENTHIADYVLIILFSFAEQLKVCFKSLSLKYLMYFRIFSSYCSSDTLSSQRLVLCSKSPVRCLHRLAVYCSWAILRRDTLFLRLVFTGDGVRVGVVVGVIKELMT